MKVSSLYRPGVVSASTRETLAEVAGRMSFSQVGSLAVYDDGRFVGIITERDITRAVADGADMEIATAGHYMTTDPMVVTPDTDTKEAVWTLLEMGVRHLPVMDAGRVVGMLSVRDLLVGIG